LEFFSPFYSRYVANCFDKFDIYNVFFLSLWVLNVIKDQKIINALINKISKVFLFLLIILSIGGGITKILYSFPSFKSNPKSNVLLIVIDCLRPDHLSCYGYTKETSPTIDDLARNGIIYTNAYSCSSWTKPSVASILTSLYPNFHGAVNYMDKLFFENLTIAEILKNFGYKTYFFNGGNWFIEKWEQFDQGFEFYRQWSSTSPMVDTFIHEISKINPQKKVFCLYSFYGRSSSL